MERELDQKTKRLALSGQLCGATLLLTLISLPLPSGYGYVNLGDAGVFLCACLLPGGLGALAAGVGAALADLILGWAMYAPVTLLVKGLTALLAGLALRRAKKAAVPLGLLCCLIVPLGYFLYETVLLTAPVAAVNVLPNTFQALLGACLGTLVGKHLKRYLLKA
ncbi:MAG: ECF transporter S component [Clostridia bacterium]|nr:ECF transporter S component [Clostridia bacterium]MBR0357058.1 ECF transporter S component [Clostridia bacterium]